MQDRWFDRGKRAFDLSIGGALLVASLPVQAVVAVAVRRSIDTPVLLRRPLPDKDGVFFELAQFRTIHVPDVDRVSGAERLTRLGRFLRSTSLEELPTLWTVVQGAMSLAGRRSLLLEYLPLHTAAQARRKQVGQGATVFVKQGINADGTATRQPSRGSTSDWTSGA